MVAKMPAPMMAPMPRATRFHGPSAFLSWCPSSRVSATSSSSDLVRRRSDRAIDESYSDGWIDRSKRCHKPFALRRRDEDPFAPIFDPQAIERERRRGSRAARRLDRTDLADRNAPGHERAADDEHVAVDYVICRAKHPLEEKQLRENQHDRAGDRAAQIAMSEVPHVADHQEDDDRDHPEGRDDPGVPL